MYVIMYAVLLSQVIKNCNALCAGLIEKGYQLVTGGSDNHMLSVDFRPRGLNGARVERVLELVGIAANKNTCPGDKSALNPSGVRLGTPSLTTRGLKESDFSQVINFIHQVVQIAQRCQEAAQAAVEPKKAMLKDFNYTLSNDETIKKEVADLKDSVSKFALKFPMLGFDNI